MTKDQIITVIRQAVAENSSELWDTASDEMLVVIYNHIMKMKKAKLQVMLDASTEIAGIDTPVISTEPIEG
jgi:hypothetical protein